MSYIVNTPAQLKPILVGYRKLKGMSQKDMAEKLNVSQQAYQALESNPQSASLERLMKVLNFLGVKLFLSDTDLNTTPEKSETQRVNEPSSFFINKPNDGVVIAEVKAKNVPSSTGLKKLDKDSW